VLSHKLITRKSAGSVAKYFVDGKDDYYSKDTESSAWHGKGATALSLSGPIYATRFQQLLKGEIVNGTNSRIGTRNDSKERIGLDLTFSAPKSVSMQALIAGDGEIIKAHDRAVQQALNVAEERAQARRKENGKSLVENTGNLAIATFRHETSREQDPQLHTHAVVLNLTQRKDGRWVALKNDEIIKSTKYLGAVYNAELALELTKLGYSLRHGRDGSFDLAHIDRVQMDGFSRRSAQIAAKLAELGLSKETATYKQKQLVTFSTRTPKIEKDRDAIFKEWHSRARDLGIDFNKERSLGPRQPINKELGEIVTAEAARRSVRFAINHLTERTAIVGEREVIDTAVKHGIGHVRLADVETAIRKEVKNGFLVKESTLYRSAAYDWQGEPKTRDGWIASLSADHIGDINKMVARVDQGIARGSLIPLEPRYTTQSALNRETRILGVEKDGRGVLQPVMAAERVAARLGKTDLNAGQRSAAALIASTHNRVVGIQGYAGTGKSHMLKEAKKLIDSEGYELRALAPYGSQVRSLRELGVGSVTVASFLKAKDKRIDNRTVLVIDEAGVIPARQMAQVLAIAEEHGSRVVLIGDSKQLPAIQAGRPFAQLQEGGMEVARMDQIQRQKNTELTIAVEHAAKGDTVRSLENISHVEEIKDNSKRRAAIAAAYVKLAPADREKTIIVSGTNEARREINGMVRAALGTAGKGVEFDTLVRRDTTNEERKWSRYYRIGDVIQPERDYVSSGLQRSSLYMVEHTGPGNRLTVRGEDGAQIMFNPVTHGHLSVYAPERQEMSVGDSVRITRNEAKLDIANGDRFRVVEVDAERLRLDDGKRQIELTGSRPFHVDHAIVSTIHSAQGLTSDRVLLDAETERRTTSKAGWYVAISRARHEAKVYTDDMGKLPAAIARENVKHAAHDLVRESRREPERALV